MRLTQFFFYSLLLFFLSCNKENRKPQWEKITVFEKSDNLKGFSTQKIITDSDRIFLLLHSSFYEYYNNLYYSPDNGKTWKKTAIGGGSFNDTMIDDICLSSSGSVFSIYSSDLSGGKIIKFNPESETTSNIPFTSYDNELMNKCSFPSDSIGYIGMSEPFSFISWIIKTSNGGFDWDTLYWGNDEIKAVQFINEDRGWFITSTHFIVTLDGGNNWDTLFSNNNNSFNYFEMANDNLGAIAGDKVWGTTDGGFNWNPILEKSVTSLSVNENGSVYVLDQDHNVSKSTNFGISWSKPCDFNQYFTFVKSKGNSTVAGVSLSIKNDGDKLKEDVYILKEK
ncbi:MAG: hypothetical protein R2780_03810 [Crocinitomicaceae bacterium]